MLDRNTKSESQVCKNFARCVVRNHGERWGAKLFALEQNPLHGEESASVPYKDTPRSKQPKLNAYDELRLSLVIFLGNN